MKKKDLSKTPDSERGNQMNDNDAEGYPLYPPSEDIYNRFKEEQDIDPEDPSKLKEDLPLDEDLESEDLIEELDPEGDKLILDLDIPGGDLDDELEDIGAEDEENNYYSIGGDNHHDLEEEDGFDESELE